MRKLSIADKQIYDLQRQGVQNIIMKTSNNIHIYYNGQIQIYSIQDNALINTIILPEIESYDAENPEQNSELTQSMIDEPSYIAGVYEKTILYYKRLVLNMYNIETNKIKQTRITEKNIIFAKHMLTNILMVQVIQDADLNKQQSSLKYYYIDETRYLNALPNVTTLKYNSQIVDIQLIDSDVEQIYFIVFENGKLAILQPPIRMHEYLPDGQEEYIKYLDLTQLEGMKLLTVQYLYPQYKSSDKESEQNVQNINQDKQKQFLAVYDKAVVLLSNNDQQDQIVVHYIKKFDNIQLQQASYNFNTGKLLVYTSNKDIIIFSCQNGTIKKLIQFKEKSPVIQFTQHSDNDVFSYVNEQNKLISFRLTEKVTHVPTISVAAVMLLAILIMVLYKRSINLGQPHAFLQDKLHKTDNVVSNIQNQHDKFANQSDQISDTSKTNAE